MVETRRGRPTMNDVAATAGVALKTVSRVVNDEPGVNAATAERVRQAIELLGYRRNDGARVLRRGRTASIGLVIEDVADPFYSGLSRAVEDVALRNGSLVFTGSSGEDPQRERELVLAFCARRVDGLVIVPAGYDHGYLAPELHAGIRAVFADRPTGPALDVDTVLCDNAGGARTGVAHLIAHGHRRIAFLGDNAVIFTAKERLSGYREALDAAGLPYDPSLVSMGPPEQARVTAAMAGMLALDHPPTALFTGNGQTTVAALRALEILSARDPEPNSSRGGGSASASPRGPASPRHSGPASSGPGGQESSREGGWASSREGGWASSRHGGQRLAASLAIVGFDDFQLADLLSPSITVVAQDPIRLGRTAAELLFRRLAGENGPVERIQLPTHLIPRGSGELPPATF
ncbi:LacI family DNA-binding transcriptional regulator [Sphaerisporangium perillae]|uniref:LacI family DNA-binding transcriptional regulator n=1 Tax=Sphaerisporangium perillae TaxID=2935860 RepID=UPI00200C108D|nr:LacI family DNA-binding transcriptional regulator [Sphaerisporangium perillae]